MYGWIAVIVFDQRLERHQEKMFSFSDKFSDLLNFVYGLIHISNELGVFYYRNGVA